MGTWGTAIKDNDAFADIYSEFYELYNKGGQPDLISKQITESNWEILEIEEEKHSFWFALALAQWETKSLDPKVLETVETIIKTEADIKIWSDTGATVKDIEKRKEVLKKFLDKLHSDRPKAKLRQKPKLKAPIFMTGDCLVFKMKNGNFGGAIVLATDLNPETANNLVATTRLNQKVKPTLTDFENSEILIRNFAKWDDKPDVVWYMPDSYNKDYSDRYENIGKIKIDIIYDPRNYEGKDYLFKPSWTGGWIMNEVAEWQFDSELSKPKPLKKLTAKQLTRKNKWWKIFK